MLLIYFIITILFAGAVIFVNNRTFSKVTIISFVAIQIALNIFALQYYNLTELTYFTFDAPALIFLTILSIILTTTTYHSLIYLRREYKRRFNSYIAALIVLSASITGAYLSNSLTVNWIFVEATTLAVAVLIYHERTQQALEATWKYVFLCSVGIAMAYMGILFLSSTVHATGTSRITYQSMAEIVAHANPVYLKITFIFILIGYSTKMELFPMHTVGIDANSVAPAQVGGFISSVMVNVGFLSIYRVYIVLANNAEVLQWMSHVLMLTGVLSLLVAAGYMLKSTHNKRMLAYSTLENVGIIAISLGVGGIGYYAAFLHIILHSFTKAGLFYQIGQSKRYFHSYELNKTGNYFKLFPAGAIVLLMGLICITAIPPSGMFISEFMTFKALISSGNWLVFIPMALFLTFVMYALFVRIFHLLFSEPLEPISLIEPVKVNPVETISQYMLFAIVIYLCFIRPPFLNDIINQAIAVIPK